MSQEFVPWGGVTDPDYHDPVDFRYLLHLDSGRLIGDDDDIPDAEYEYFLDDLAAIKDVRYLSASLVDRFHPVLWQGTSSAHGFIIEVPEEGVLATAPRDMRLHTQARELDDIMRAAPPMEPNALLEATRLIDWNEVVVSTQQLIVRAAFWVIDSGETDRSADQFDLETVRAKAHKIGLQVVELALLKY